MSEIGFLPSFPLPFSAVLLFGSLMLAGVVGGWLVERFLGLPRIAGYVITGLFLGPTGAGVLDPETLHGARIFVEIALGLVLYDLGHRLRVRWLLRERWLLATGVLESFATFAAIFAALVMTGESSLPAAIAAAIGMAASPAVVLVVARDLQSEGQVTERALNLVAINSGLAVLVLTLLISYAHLARDAGWAVAAAHPAYLLLGSVLLGLAMGLLGIVLARWIGKREDAQFILVVALIAVTTGLAQQLNLSLILGLLALGLFSRNLDRGHAMLPVELGYAFQLFVAVLFVLTGASLRLEALGPAAAVVGLYVLARLAAKTLVIGALSRLSGLSLRQGALLGLSQLPMAGAAIVLVESTTSFYPEFGAGLAGVVLAAIALLEILGPIATQLAFRLAGEAGGAVRQ